MIIVTGGAGFIGSNLVALLERSGAERIVVCDRLRSEEKWRNISKREIYDFVQPEQLWDYIALHADEIDTIFHLGAISSTTQIDADLIVANNFQLTAKLWDWCTDHEVRLIYASSASTYGDGSAGYTDDESPDALAKLNPLNNYAWSKHVFDRRVARIVAQGGRTPPQWAGLKFFNVYGPNEYHKGSQISVANLVYNLVAQGKPARLFKSYEGAPDEPKRDFVWVGNCAAVCKFLWEKPELSGLFNVGTGEARSFVDLANTVFTALGKSPRIDYVEMPVEMRPRYQYFTEANIGKLCAAGFIAPFLSIEEGVTRYVTDFLATSDPYR